MNLGNLRSLNGCKDSPAQSKLFRLVRIVFFAPSSDDGHEGGMFYKLSELAPCLMPQRRLAEEGNTSANFSRSHLKHDVLNIINKLEAPPAVLLASLKYRVFFRTQPRI